MPSLLVATSFDLITDIQSPTIAYCPTRIDVFRYSKYDGPLFQYGEVLGYPSPMFSDNEGKDY